MRNFILTFACSATKMLNYYKQCNNNWHTKYKQLASMGQLLNKYVKHFN